MPKNAKKLALCVAIPLVVGGLAALLSGGFSQVYLAYKRPPLSPPGWVFGVVWPILYALMGWASYLVLEAPERDHKPIIFYGVQLGLNFLWPILFFRFGLVGWALALLCLLWVAVLVTIRIFMEYSERAGDLLIPYILWLSFALYLNFGIFVLN